MIVMNRDNWFVRKLFKISQFLRCSYLNDSWDIGSNGESFVFETVVHSFARYSKQVNPIIFDDRSK